MKNNKLLLEFLISLTMLLVLNCCISNKKEDNSALKQSAVSSKIQESDFYVIPEKFKNIKNFEAIDNDFNTDDSKELQIAIDKLSKIGGGKLLIPKGNYALANINLKSNVHLSFSSDAEIRPYENNVKENYAVFKVTNNSSSQPVKNVSISGDKGMFKIDLTHLKNKSLRVIQTWNAKNFVFRNILIEDDYSEFAALEFNAVKINDTIYGPRNGLVKNISVRNAHYGFGVVQLQYGSKILFKDLYGLGGATLRIETHNHTLLDASKFSISDNIYGRNIISENGNSALMLSPHFVKNGKIDVDNLTSIGSGFGMPTFIVTV